MANNMVNGYQIPKYQQINNVASAAPQVKSQPVGTVNPNSVDKTPKNDTFTQSNPGQGEQQDKSMLKPALILGSTYGLSKLNTAFDKACGGDYETSLLGKFGRLGDKISNKYGNSKLADSTRTAFEYSKERASKYIDSKPLLSAMAHTPTKPENSFVTQFLQTQEEYDLDQATKAIEKYATETPKSLKAAGATKEEIDAIKSKYGTNIFGNIKNKKQAIQEFQLSKIRPDLIGKIKPENYEQALKYRKMHHLGFIGDEFESGFFGKSSLNKSAQTKDRIIEACKTKASPELTQSFNKLVSGSMHSTMLGKLFTKIPKVFMRGLTFGGGAVNLLFIGWGLGTAFYNTIKAPKKQKAGTAVAGGVDAVSWVVSMPVALGMMHAVNGMKYVGLSKEQVSKYRAALKDFNLKAKAGLFKDEAEHNEALKKVLSLKEAKAPQGKFTKFMKKVADVLSVSLEMPKPYKVNTSELSGVEKWAARLANMKRKMPNLLKDCAGYPIRFAIYAAIAQPIIDKVISSCTSAIFGKPYDPDKAKEEAEKSKSKNDKYPPHQRFVIPDEYKGKIKSNIDIASLPDANLVKQKVSGGGNTKPSQPSYVPSDKPAVSTSNAPARTYIPQEIPTNVQLEKNANDIAAEQAIAQTDKLLKAKGFNS